MRKMILMAIAGYLWKKYKAHHATSGVTNSATAGTAASGPSRAATAGPSARR